MNHEKWKLLLDMQQVRGTYHPSLGKEYIAQFLKYASPERLRKVLRIGHGEGVSELRGLRERGFQVETITIQDWQEDRQMDMHDMEFLPDSFDAIYAIQTFEHAYAPWLLLLECWTVLRMGGILFFVVPQDGTHKVVTHPNLLTEDQWLNSLDFCGFKPIDHFTQRYQVTCRCEDDYGNLKGFEAEHDVSCITVAAEKTVPTHRETAAMLERLREIHGRRKGSPVGVR